MINKKVLIVLLGLTALLLLVGTVLLEEGIVPEFLKPYMGTIDDSSSEPELDMFLQQYTTEDMARITPADAAEYQRFQEAVQKSSAAHQVPDVQVVKFAHIPVAYNGYPRPEGYLAEVAQRIEAADMQRYEESIRNLVQNFGPRDPDQFQVFVDLQICNPGGIRFDKSNLQRALEDTQSRLKSLGYKISIEQLSPSNTYYNIIAEKSTNNGSKSDSIIEIAAHIDSEPSTPGASRNAAGLAGILEMAEVLKDYPNQHPWRFIVFVENGSEKLGSQSHVQSITGQPLKTALILDGIGWSGIETSNSNCVVTNQALPYTQEIARMFDAVRQPYEISIGWEECLTAEGFSSETSYWQAGIPAVLSVGGLPYKNPTQDKCSDNLANLNLVNAFLTVRQNIAVLLLLDQEP